jgi:hypothetical protein
MGSILLSLLTITTALIEGSFVPIGGHDGIQVYLRKSASVIDLAAVGDFEAPPVEVQAALLDYGAHARVNAHLAESRVLSRRPGDQFVYQRLKLPVISDRDFTLHVVWRAGEARGLRFTIDGERGPAATSSAVRMTLLVGRWDLEPLAGGRATRAVYHVQLDFAGSVPRGMVRGGAAKDLPSVYLGMRRLIVERRGAGKAAAVD